MDQISLPMRIALVASLAFAALWFVALRPKPVEENVDGPLPTVSAAEVDKGSSKAASTPTEKAEPTKQAESTPKPVAEKKAAAKPAQASGPQAALADIKAGRTVVLLFAKRGGASDDRAVRSAVSRIDRHDGKVRVHVARMNSLPKYEAVIKNVPVTTSPTLLVINRSKQAQVITGLTTTREVDQAVRAALKK